MTISAIQTYIIAIEEDASLRDETNFDQRIEVIDFIGFQVIDQLEALLQNTDHPESLPLLRARAEKLRCELEEIDRTLFLKLRTTIRTKALTGNEFKELITEYVDLSSDNPHDQAEPGYDNLDIFINGLSLFQAMPEQTKILESDMVGYQKTPARVVFELVERFHFRQEDVFFDLGSGLGQVAILVNFLTGVTVKGIEFEPAFCDYAGDCAADLNLSNVTFINVDARKADYSKGTIFFMYTPFRGGILEEVLAALRKESLGRKIKIITYGPCTAQVALQSWLELVAPGDSNIYKPAIFNSF
jgi:SAM-dependent methyltransferase